MLLAVRIIGYMLSILADECVDVQLVFRLRRLGYAVSTVRDFCQSKYGDGIDDRAVLELGVHIVLPCSLPMNRISSIFIASARGTMAS